MKKRVFLTALTLVVLLLAGCADGGPEGTFVDVSPTPPQTAAVLPTALPEASPTWGEEEYWVLFLNVGRADAALICANGQYWLVDTGTKDGADALVATLGNLGVTRLEGVFLTHTHGDHAGGAKRLAGVIPVAMFYRAAITTLTDKGKDKLSGIAEDAGVPETKLAAGDALELNGAALEVLGPVVTNADDDNDNSLVFKLTANGHTVLFTGDMQFAEEETLVDRDVSCEVLKVANHGNPDATGEAFAAAAAPRVAVISTDTLEDTDSANARVRGALSGADIYVTEHFAVGVMVDLSGGEIAVSDPGFDPASQAAALRAGIPGMLVNRENTLGADYTPEGLVDIASYDIPALTLKSDGLMGYGEAVAALGDMMGAAKDAGISGFYLVSAYRTYAEQRALWDEKVADDPAYGADPSIPVVTAYPGASEHQTGLAFDISAVNAKALSARFADTPQGEWLYHNAWRFGFILRYPGDVQAQAETGIVFEPWHFRYVGKPLAAYLYRTGITLERFYSTYLSEGAA
ncbi:MAG TPA: D-alanyl-D-alanine carboxypeptidase family protein [Clostridia bacterium]|nr:D-alanyl-D-alanine carboxypeptidase family protein [Clostridia bacterium]